MVELLIAGKTNKNIAAELNLSSRGVEDRRSKIMKKLDLKTVAELLELVASTKSS